MKKVIRILSLLAAMVLALTMFAGCKEEGEATASDDEKKEIITMTIGIPVDQNDPEWSDWEAVLASWVEDFAMFSSIELKFTKVPTEEKALKSFMKKVDSGKIACFFTERQDFIDQLIEDNSIVDIPTMQSVFSVIMEEASDCVYTLSQESDLNNYMYPIYGEFQGLYYNRTLLKSLEIENPTTWDALLAAIEKLKENNITPIAAGFKDEGLSYMVEEMILSEGGTAEHSYTPTFGVMSSWERAVDDLKTLEKAGAFTEDCYNVTFDEAVESFLNGEAAMIVAPSNAFDGQLSVEDVKVVPFPSTPSGKREEGAFIGRFTHGVYVSRAFFNKTDERSPDAIAEILGSDYFGSSDFYELFKTESTLCADVAYYDEWAETHYDNSLKSLMANAKAGDWYLYEHAYAYDAIIDGFRKAMTGNDATAALQEASDAEIAAAEAAKKE